MQAKDLFLKVRDYIDAQNILDELDKFLGEDDLLEFCDYLKEEYDIDMSDDDFYEDDEF